MEADKEETLPIIQEDDHTTNPAPSHDEAHDVVQGEEKEDKGVAEKKKKKKKESELSPPPSLIGLSKKEETTRYEICKYFDFLLFVISFISNSIFFCISASCLQDMVGI